MTVQGLPSPVLHYFEIVLPEPQRVLRYARISQRGEFLVRPPDVWRPFTATHQMTINPPGFIWDARIRLFPGLAIRVRDSFLQGVGSMRADVLGVFPIVNMLGTPELAIGALQRYLAEAAWCPTALLPGNGVQWTPLDGASARATLAVAGTRVSLEFHFDQAGLIERVFTPSRPRAVGKGFVATPWQGRFSSYAERGGMWIPHEGEVEWLLTDRPQTYWRGRIVDALFEAAPPESDPHSPIGR